MCPDHEKLAQVPVAHFGNGAQPRFAASGVLPGSEAQPGCELTSTPKQLCIRDAGRKTCRNDRAYSGYGREPGADVVVAMSCKDRLVELGYLRFHLRQCRGQWCKRNANGLRVVSFIVKDSDELADIAGALWRDNAKLGKVATHGIDEPSPLRNQKLAGAV